ncbi:MAG TPA: hypothetical protein VEK79_12565 [Thermoanaerobaculia bacterium]|nr:hypothetical protein [Thermoanaerobaculia bacterium]
MIRALLFALVLSLVTIPIAAGTIQWNGLVTYDTGIRLANGRWKIRAEVDMTYLDIFGDIAEGDWEAELWINNIHNGSLLIGTGTQFFRSKHWKTSIEAYANFDACYQGKAYAAAGGDVKQVGGNHVCTDPRPPTTDPPTCTDGSNPANCYTPIVLSLRGRYRMTSAAEGVLFDIDSDGTAEQIAWTDPNSDVGFLALDRNNNGTIDSGAELFGNSTALTNGGAALNGFEALADLDSNHDGRIDAADPSWQQLLLWLDTNHDGASTAAELVPIPSSEVSAISTDYQLTGRKDHYGNEFRYKGEFRIGQTWRKCYDVYLVTAH